MIFGRKGLGLALSAILALTGLTAPAMAASASWAANQSGNWSDTSKWNPSGTFPNGIGQSAYLGVFGTQSIRTVTVDQDVTIGSLSILSQFSGDQYAVSGANTITMNNGVNEALIYMNRSGSSNGNSLSAPLDVAGNLEIRNTVQDQTISSRITTTASGLTLRKTGNGQTIVSNANNDFGDNTISAVGGILQFRTNANAPGGINTTILFPAGGGGSVYLAADPNTVWNIGTVIFDGGTGAFTMTRVSSGIIQRTHTVKSITVNAGKTGQITSQWGFGMTIPAGESITLNPGSTLNMTGAANSFDGGKLRINGVLQGSGTLTSASGNGTNTPDIIIQSGGKLAPGLSTGILNITTQVSNNGRLIFNSGSTFEVEIYGNTPGTDYDQINLAGAITLNNPTLDIILDFKLAPGPNDILTIIQNDGTDAVAGAFLGLPEGATISFGDVYPGREATAQISYVGGTGNDVILYNFDIPEPASLALMALGLLALAPIRRRAA